MFPRIFFLCHGSFLLVLMRRFQYLLTYGYNIFHVLFPRHSAVASILQGDLSSLTHIPAESIRPGQFSIIGDHKSGYNGQQRLLNRHSQRKLIHFSLQCALECLVGRYRYRAPHGIYSASCLVDPILPSTVCWCIVSCGHYAAAVLPSGISQL